MGLRIGELSKMTGVPISTIRYYAGHGLLPAPQKVGRLLSHYDESCVHKLQTILYLQENRHFPLSIIKNILRRMDSGMSLQDAESVEDVIFSSQTHAVDGRMLNRAEFLAQTGLTAEELKKAEKMGLVMPFIQDEGREFYNHEDVLWGKNVLKSILPYKNCWDDFVEYMKQSDRMIDLEFAIREKIVRSRSAKENMDISIELSKAAEYSRGYLLRRLFQKKIQARIKMSLKEK
ncbi:MAG TPA: MerR family transcriptional regulator [Syntrophales bacterium]|nr:MerR family transcriptional regulator [Syntrophales bacterium]